MKRIIAAVSLAVLAVPALAVELGKPYEELDVERALPSLRVENVRFAAATGATVSDASMATSAAPTESPWANDYNFIAPAQ